MPLIVAPWVEAAMLDRFGKEIRLGDRVVHNMWGDWDAAVVVVAENGEWQVGRFSLADIAENVQSCDTVIAVDNDCTFMHSWHPIETAPKSGETVLLAKDDEQRCGPYVLVGYYSWDITKSWWVAGGHELGYFSDWAEKPQDYPGYWRVPPCHPRDALSAMDLFATMALVLARAARGEPSLERADIEDADWQVFERQARAALSVTGR
jgi:hypothetical protein